MKKSSWREQSYGLMAVVCSGILGCSSYATEDSDAETIDEVAEAFRVTGDSWFAPGFNKTVPFCWCQRESCSTTGALIPSSTALTNMKQWTQQIVTASWAKSGLTITWTDPCPTSGTQKFVFIEPINTSGLGGAFSIGASALKSVGEGRSGHLPYHSSFNARQVMGLSAHETGHVMDLAHTQERSDGPSFCSGSSSSGRLTMFDGMSVMATNNQCRGGLSRTSSPAIVGPTGLDLAGLQMYYGFPTPWSDSSRNFCVTSTEELVFGDFDGDDKTDMVCNNTGNGALWLERAHNGFSGSDWSATRNFCGGSNDKLRVGDFDGNGRDDLLCLHKSTGLVEIDLSSSTGRFEGTDWSGDIDYCTGSQDNLYVGKFDANATSDLLCNHRASGDLTIDEKSTNPAVYFTGTPNWTHSGRNYCITSSERLSVGDFDGDGMDDLLCENLSNGALRVDLANDTFNDSDVHQSGRSFCGSDHRLRVADVSGDGRKDIVCWDRSTGMVTIDTGDRDGLFDDVRPDGTIYFKVRGTLADFCIGDDVELHVHDFNNDGKADFMCHGNDLKVEYSQLPLPRVYHQLPVVAGAPYVSESITVPSGSHLQALMVDTVNDAIQNANLEVIGPSNEVLCSSSRSKSFEVCEVNGPGTYRVRVSAAVNTPDEVTVHAYVMPGSFF